MDMQDKDMKNIIKILDKFCVAEEGRMKIEVSENLTPESTHRTYHHGLCDIGSPFEKGTAFDLDDN